MTPKYMAIDLSFMVINNPIEPQEPVMVSVSEAYGLLAWQIWGFRLRRLMAE